MITTTVYEKLEQLVRRLEEIDLALADPALMQDYEKLKSLTKERSDIEQVVEQFREYQKVLEEINVMKELLKDEEFKNDAKDELVALNAQEEELTAQLHEFFTPKDPNAGKPVLLEIRAGTGGDEASLFAECLLRMYMRYCDMQGWKNQIISESPTDIGGYREVILRIEGKDAYTSLRLESGVHRVQRVPVTDTQGRIQTSAATVAVMPEIDDVEFELNEKDLRMDYFRASGAGGQNVQKNDTAVRITHIPTGTVVECQDERSQAQNRKRALTILSTRLYNQQLEEQQAKIAQERKCMVGSGDRSERIRTYNYPQGRVTDHRINLTIYKLNQVMQGHLEEIITPLMLEQEASLLNDPEAQL